MLGDKCHGIGQSRNDNPREDREQIGHEGAQDSHLMLMNIIVSKLPFILLAMTITLMTSGLTVCGPYSDIPAIPRGDALPALLRGLHHGGLKRNIQAMPTVNSSLPVKDYRPPADRKGPSEALVEEEDRVAASTWVKPKTKVKLNTSGMEHGYVRKLLCSSAQHFLDGKYPVLGPT